MRNAISRISSQILNWKTKYGPIFYIKLNKSEYVFKILTKGEYTTILGLQEHLKIDTGEIILKECLLYPKFNKRTFDQKLAGEVESLLECIGRASGFSETEKVLSDLEAVRGSIGSLENQIIILICKAFPHLTLQDINNFTYEEIMRYVAISEVVLDVKLSIEKPTTNKTGTIDFDEENRKMSGDPVPHGRVPKQKPRGDASR